MCGYGIVPDRDNIYVYRKDGELDNILECRFGGGIYLKTFSC